MFNLSVNMGAGVEYRLLSCVMLRQPLFTNVSLNSIVVGYMEHSNLFSFSVTPGDHYVL